MCSHARDGFVFLLNGTPGTDETAACCSVTLSSERSTATNWNVAFFTVTVSFTWSEFLFLFSVCVCLKEREERERGEREREGRGDREQNGACKT